MSARPHIAAYHLLILVLGIATFSKVYAQGTTPPAILTGYTSLEPLCEKYDLRCDYDRMLQKFTLSNGDHTLVFTPQSEYALVNRNVVKMSGKAKLVRGELQIPSDAVPEIERLLGQPIPRRERRLTVVIDAGHGGKDPGALARRYKMHEKDICLDIAKRLKRLLENDNFKVVMTRETDVFLELQERCDVANKAGADVFISIHVNAARNRTASGVEVYYPPAKYEGDLWAGKQSAEFGVPPKVYGSREGDSKELNDILIDILCEEYRVQSKELAEEIHNAMVEELGAAGRGARCNRNFHVLRATNCTSVLVEVGFISNREEERLLNDASYRQRIAVSIADGLKRFRRMLEDRLAP